MEKVDENDFFGVPSKVEASAVKKATQDTVLGFHHPRQFQARTFTV